MSLIGTVSVKQVQHERFVPSLGDAGITTVIPATKTFDLGISSATRTFDRDIAGDGTFR
jgi:hypothetical protein